MKIIKYELPGLVHFKKTQHCDCLSGTSAITNVSSVSRFCYVGGGANPSFNCSNGNTNTDFHDSCTSGEDTGSHLVANDCESGTTVTSVSNCVDGSGAGTGVYCDTGGTN
ncbi:MAG: hypothetical protein ABIA04_10420 [Pseudomonadota bacterium]